MKTVLDHTLIEQTLLGDKTAFRLLVLRYQQPVFNLLGALLADKAAVEDIAQETFLRAYQSLGTFDLEQDSGFRAWLYTIARNLAYNELKRLRTRKRNQTELAHEPASPAPNAEEGIDRLSTANAVRDLFLGCRITIAQPWCSRF